jgi:acetyl-CoA C-acetyltransferase
VARIAALWSRFSRVAAENPHAWIRRGFSVEEIAAPSLENRLVALPYTKLLTANMQVNLGAGLIMCSAQAARDAGVPSDRWVFVHAGAQARDEWHVSERASIADSPAIRAIGRAALGHAGIAIDDTLTSTCTRASRPPCRSPRASWACRLTSRRARSLSRAG